MSGACKNLWRASERKSCAPQARAKSGAKKRGGPIAGQVGQGWAPVPRTQWSTNFARRMISRIFSSSDLRYSPPWPVIRRPRRSRRSPTGRRSTFSRKNTGSTERKDRCLRFYDKEKYLGLESMLVRHSGARRKRGGFF